MKLLRIYSSESLNTVAYHGSGDPNLTISKIDVTSYRAEPGFHCGTKEQALNRIKNLHNGSGYLYEVHIDARNILELSDDLGDQWSRFTSYVDHAVNPNNKLLSYEDEYGVVRPSAVTNTLRTCGYDCVMYPNRYEGKGTSYMIIDKSCISYMKLLGKVENNEIKESIRMKRVIKSSLQKEERPSDYLISCIQDDVIGMKTVLSEVLKYLSEDDIREVNEALGLYDIDSSTKVVKASNISKFDSMKEQLNSEWRTGLDPLDERTDAGEYVIDLSLEVEKDLGIFSEPSIQGGFGGVWLYNESYHKLAADVDYQDFNETLINCVLSSSNEQEAKNKMKKYYEKLIS